MSHPGEIVEIPNMKRLWDIVEILHMKEAHQLSHHREIRKIRYLS